MTDIKDLIRGYKEFHQKYFASGDKLYKKLASVGQSPKTLIIACSDSRVDPSIVTNSNPGDIFVIRNVANLVPAFESDHGHHGVSAALEFAVKVLKVENIIVLGHTQCAGIATLMHPENLKGTDFIEPWIDIAKTARERTIEKCIHHADETEMLHHCEKEVIALSLGNLLSFSWIKDRVENKTLQLHGWYFNISDGAMQHYNPEHNTFEIIKISKDN